METTSHPTVASSDKLDKPDNADKEHILDLNKYDVAEYENFIKSIRGKFDPPPEEKLCDTVGKDTQRESKILDDVKKQLNLCFDGASFVLVELTDDNSGEVSPKQTPFEKDVTPDKKFFQVRLIYEQGDLHILIQRSSLYLVGYKGKYKPKEEEATVNKDDKAKIDENAECKDDKMEIDDKAQIDDSVEYWIILSGACYDAAVEYVEKFLAPVKPKKVNLGSSYFSLFSTFDPEFDSKKKEALASDLYTRLTGRLEILINKVEKTDYVVQLLQLLKNVIEIDGRKMFSPLADPKVVQNWKHHLPGIKTVDRWKDADNLINWLEKLTPEDISTDASEPEGVDSERVKTVDRWKDADNLLNWLEELRPEDISTDAREPASVDSEGVKKFKNFWLKRKESLEKKSQRDSMRKLKTMLEEKHKVCISPGQSGSEAEEQQRAFNESLISWETEIEKALDILRSLGYNIEIEKEEHEKEKELNTKRQRVKKKDVIKREAKRVAKEKEERKKKVKTDEELSMGLLEKIELIELLEKEIPQEDKSAGKMKKTLTEELEAEHCPREDESTGKMKKILTEELKAECRQLLKEGGTSEQLKIKNDELDRGIKNCYSEVMVAEDLFEFYEELKNIGQTLKNLMRYFKTGASYSVENGKTTELKVNREALIRAVEHLAQHPFEDDQEDFAKHITHLVVMICEATRFEPIADHINKCYTSMSNSNLSEDNVLLINMWSDLSAIMARGWSYKGERDSGMVDSIKFMAVSKAMDWHHSSNDK